MKKILHSMAIALVALASLFTLALAVGCNNQSTDPNKMTVTIQYENGTPFNGEDARLCIQICKETDDGACKPLTNYPADKNGKIVFSLTASDVAISDISEGYKIEILASFIPDGYTSEALHGITSGGNYTLILKAVA